MLRKKGFTKQAPMMANEAANVEQRCAVLTMPSLSGDPLQGTEKAPGLAPAQPHLRKCRNGALNAPTATGAVITALPAKPNCWCAPQKPRTVRSRVVGQHTHQYTECFCAAEVGRSCK